MTGADAAVPARVRAAGEPMAAGRIRAAAMAGPVAGRAAGRPRCAAGARRGRTAAAATAGLRRSSEARTGALVPDSGHPSSRLVPPARKVMRGAEFTPCRERRGDDGSGIRRDDAGSGLLRWRDGKSLSGGKAAPRDRADLPARRRDAGPGIRDPAHGSAESGARRGPWRAGDRYSIGLSQIPARSPRATGFVTAPRYANRPAPDSRDKRTPPPVRHWRGRHAS